MSAGTLDVDVRGVVGTFEVHLAFRASSGATVVVGPNGAGKTTALLMILGAVPPRQGRVLLDGAVLFDGDRGVNLPVENRGIGFVPQRYGLFPHLDVLSNVAYGLAPGPASGLAPARGWRARAARLETAQAALRAFGADKLASRRPSQLSGGESQRVALARAIAAGPRALLLDEPLAALDASVRPEMRRYLAEHIRALAIPTVIVTHDRADAEAFQNEDGAGTDLREGLGGDPPNAAAGEVVVMEQGAVVQRGRLGDLSARPATEFVRQFARS